jgi:hypothetical protein
MDSGTAATWNERCDNRIDNRLQNLIEVVGIRNRNYRGLLAEIEKLRSEQLISTAAAIMNMINAP